MDKLSDKVNSGPEAVRAYQPGDVPVEIPDGEYPAAFGDGGSGGKDVAAYKKASKKVSNPVIYPQGSDGSVDGKI